MYEKWKLKVKLLSQVRLFATPWTVPARLLHPWDFQGKITGVGCYFLLQGIEPGSPALQADSLPSEPQGKYIINHIFLWMKALSLPN